MKIFNKLVVAFILSYFVSYSALGFEVIIKVGFLPWQFLTILVINFAIITALLNIQKVSKNFRLTIGFKVILLMLSIGTFCVHIFSTIMGKKLGPSLIKLSEQQTLATTNTFLVKLNIIILLLIFISSLIVGFILDRKQGKQTVRNYFYYFLIILILFSFTFVLWSTLNVLNLLYGLSTGG